jgi:chorismate dehydratase
MSKMNVTAVSYLNTKPLLFGLLQHAVSEQLDLSLDIPSECARKLKEGEAQIGLIPVAAIADLPEAYLLSDYCIGADGEVKTVAVFSEVPIQEVTDLFLDYHSRTSVQLTRVLLREYWNCTPQLHPTTPGYESRIKGTTAGLVIGDRAIGLEERFPYVYDLAEVWKEWTGLPFVFAAWVSTVPMQRNFIIQFNEALRMGIGAIPKLMYILPSPKSGFDLETYFTRHISYELDDQKRKALAQFYQRSNLQIPATFLKDLSLSAPA